ncbi:hypothetical protein PEL8287_03187 [Roseovarius litorisediminis]|uniref:Phosphotyrosine protein phosphatase I domain-containing protein n=1 Tax=Roseovarius litorisediminis TaxID=1312363 RepID=A0A1Y5TAJ1_9RHOB|nr:hypothetical protein PEL8287_03187 [Roseovarius litorisediminis]
MLIVAIFLHEMGHAWAVVFRSARPAGNNTPVRLLTDYAPQSGKHHIPDPYYTHDFEGTLDLIEQAVKGLNAAIG